MASTEEKIIFKALLLHVQSSQQVSSTRLVPILYTVLTFTLAQIFSRQNSFVVGILKVKLLLKETTSTLLLHMHGINWLVTSNLLLP